MRTIRLHPSLLLCFLLVAAPARAQSMAPDPLARGAWHVEFSTHAAAEAWNYNANHEELYGIQEGLTYGLRDGLVLTMAQRVYYVSQRAQDGWLLGLTAGLRGRIVRRGRLTGFWEFGLGVSDTAIAAPPRGTRFNYLALGSAGVLVGVRPRLSLLAAIEWLHVSNNSLKGASRNPDIEAIGPRLGVLLGF